MLIFFTHIYDIQFYAHILSEINIFNDFDVWVLDLHLRQREKFYPLPIKYNSVNNINCLKMSICFLTALFQTMRFVRNRGKPFLAYCMLS